MRCPFSQDLTTTVQISSNQLTSLPAWLGQLTQLEHLFVRVAWVDRCLVA